MRSPERSYLPSCPLMCTFDPFKFRIRGTDHAEETPTLPTRIQGGQDGFVDDDGRPRPKCPDEHRLNRQVAVWLQKDP